MNYPFTQNEEDMKSYLEALVQDAEELLGETEQDNRSNVISARNKLKLNIASLKYKIHLIEESIREKAQMADSYVRENPWKSMGVASATTLGIGLILGFILGKEHNK